MPLIVFLDKDHLFTRFSSSFLLFFFSLSLIFFFFGSKSLKCWKFPIIIAIRRFALVFDESYCRGAFGVENVNKREENMILLKWIRYDTFLAIFFHLSSIHLAYVIDCSWVTILKQRWSLLTCKTNVDDVPSCVLNENYRIRRNVWCIDLMRL